jgi:hypothetical protein
VLTDWKEGVVLEGPGVFRRLEFEPDWGRIPEESARRGAARLDGVDPLRRRTNESVKVPLGDLCGVPWRRVRAQSLYFGMEGDALFCAFPMPFAKSRRSGWRRGGWRRCR